MVDGAGLLKHTVADGVGQHGVVFDNEQVHRSSTGHGAVRDPQHGQ
ncbi:hypothetical protein XOC_4277 [Xanthomonas oryzae pv. oryzicola BLS256]|uniref:Uncharacterized protein n=1 Tax=Xanthomonas oryzae pv. oryzicola (strain BLS256) TaxID=383407 RepID=G7TLA2_XANOB|nr:hypothetical protein XOC_4277 [Xanthomonas oryzae pv. oryzicola BLS256]